MSTVLIALLLLGEALLLLGLWRWGRRMQRESQESLARMRASEARIKAIADAALGRTPS